MCWLTKQLSHQLISFNTSHRIVHIRHYVLHTLPVVSNFVGPQLLPGQTFITDKMEYNFKQLFFYGTSYIVILVISWSLSFPVLLHAKSSARHLIMRVMVILSLLCQPVDWSGCNVVQCDAWSIHENWWRFPVCFCRQQLQVIWRYQSVPWTGLAVFSLLTCFAINFLLLCVFD